VYKRYLTAMQLADELHGDSLLEGTWFVAARVRWPSGCSPSGPAGVTRR
jgi:hypothetical protein